jgi:hypothetical protein
MLCEMYINLLTYHSVSCLKLYKMSCVPCYQVCEKCTESRCSQFTAIAYDSGDDDDCNCECHTCKNCKYQYFAYEEHDKCNLCEKCGQYAPYDTWLTNHCQPCVDCGIYSHDALYNSSHQRCRSCDHLARLKLYQQKQQKKLKKNSRQNKLI